MESNPDKNLQDDTALDTTFDDVENEERSGPFAVAPVDPIIFKQSTDNPELREAAAYVQMARRDNARPTQAAPTARQKKDHTAWTPAGALPSGDVPASETSSNSTSSVRVIVTVVAVALPLAAIGAAIWFGISLLS
jgi:hypothetical protein